MARVTIDGKTVEVADGSNIVDAAAAAEIEIPHYCYHPGLPVAGNCRMCLVDIRALSEKQNNPLPKLQIGCNTLVQDGMVVETVNEKVRQARKCVLEFLLINHPIDCPICDQAGECKLQEYYMDYGRYGSRFELEEKVSKGKVIPVGSNIMLDQERCILCTRCIRFLDDVTHTHELAITNRGDHSEITLAHGKSVDNAYATNIVDICPVGALTSRRFRFRARVWYLDSTDSICTGCATGCNIEVHSRKDVIYRLKPRYNADVNGYWMCDYGRTTFEHNQDELRLRSSLTRDAGAFLELDAKAAARDAARTLARAKKLAILASANVTVEEGYLLTALAQALGGASRHLVSPAISEVADDGMLVATDRYPNRRGLLSLGFVESTTVDADADAVLIVRCDPVADDEAWGVRLETMQGTVVASDRAGQSTAYADQVLAVGSHFESDGCYMNRQGRLQRAGAAVRPPGQAVPGWSALAELLAAAGGQRYATADAVLEAALEHLKADTSKVGGRASVEDAGAKRA